MPHLPIEFIDNLRGSTEIRVVGIPYFTGWKEVMENWGTPIERGMERYCGQWVVWDNPTRSFIAVNLPGMEVSRGLNGQVLEIGAERVYKDTPRHVINAMLTTGYQKLREEMNSDADS